jgi:hypothetical protein
MTRLLERTLTAMLASDGVRWWAGLRRLADDSEGGCEQYPT